MDSIPGLAQWVKDPSSIVTSCSSGSRGSLDPVLLWLWHRPAAAALIQPLAWELPYATAVAIKQQQQQQQQQKNPKNIENG